MPRNSRPGTALRRALVRRDFQDKLYKQLGFSSMNAYAAQELNLSLTQTGDFIQLAKKLDRLPALKEGLASGRLGYTQARVIAPVVDEQNEKQWLEQALTLPRRKLEASVRRSRVHQQLRRKTDPDQGSLLPLPEPADPPAAQPVRVGFELTPAQFARYEKLLAGIGHHRDRNGLLLAMMENYLDAGAAGISPRGEKSAVRPPYQIHVHECPQCGKAAVPTPRGEKELSPAEKDAVHCDAQVHRPGQPNKSAIAPSVRLDTLERYRHRCRRKGCRHTRFLALHHIVPRAVGGSNRKENLVTLCAGCHDLWHEQGGDLRGMLTEIDE